MARPRKPTAVHIANGNPSRKKLNPEAEPQPTLGVGKMPAGMPSEAARMWTLVVSELDRLNLLGNIDVYALELCCRGYAQFLQADRAALKIQKRINAGKAEQNDFYKLSILSSVRNKGHQQFKAYATEFGLTAAARSRLTVEAAAPIQKATGGQKLSPMEAALCANKLRVQ